MGYRIATLRTLRSRNIGNECSVNLAGVEQFREIIERMGDIKRLDRRHLNMVIRYIVDMDRVIAECRRVMKRNGKAIFVIGDCTIGGVFIRNSECLVGLGNRNGLELSSRITRQLPENRRYLPPPNLETSGPKMQSRIKEEVILHFN